MCPSSAETSLRGPSWLAAVGTVAHLTFVEARRRRIVAAALVLGSAFVLLFGIGFYFILRETANERGPDQLMGRSLPIVLALYAANFLVVMTSVLITIDTFAGEIGSGVIEAICTKPLGRSAVTLGKWLGCWVILTLYALLLCGGILLVARLLGGYASPHIGRAIALILLEGTVLMTLAIAGGTRLSTLANGVTIFGLYGLAFIGGWMDQLGTLARSETVRYLGIGASLLVPSESLWQLAAYYLQPPITRDLHMGPFLAASVPSPAMVVWAFGYIVVVLALAVRSFQARDL
jgi:ABC-type transport system involved in multi-copper enzyme maturation permease subunit